MSFHFPLARRAGPVLVGALLLVFQAQAQTMSAGGGAPPVLPDRYFPGGSAPPVGGIGVTPMDEAASLVEPPPNSLPVQFPLIQEEYGYPVHESPASSRGYPQAAGTGQRPYVMPRMTAQPPVQTPRAGAVPGLVDYRRPLPGNPAALSVEGQKQFRRMLREARSRTYAFTGRLMKERDALEVLYENNPYPEAEAVGAIYGRIFAVQREMVEDRVRRTNALRKLFQRYRLKARQPQPAVDSTSGGDPVQTTAPPDPS